MLIVWYSDTFKALESYCNISVRHELHTGGLTCKRIFRSILCYSSSTYHRRRNQGSTRGTCPPLGKNLPFSAPPFKLSGTVTFLTIPRRWNTCSDGSAIPEHGERRSKNTRPGILAALSPNIPYFTVEAPTYFDSYNQPRLGGGRLFEHAAIEPWKCPPKSISTLLPCSCINN